MLLDFSLTRVGPRRDDREHSIGRDGGTENHEDTAVVSAGEIREKEADVEANVRWRDVSMARKVHWGWPPRYTECVA